MQSIKYIWLNLLPFGKMPSMISLPPVMKIGIIFSFLPMAGRVLRMTYVGDRASIFEEG
jgi:hypothetical protein